MLATVLAYNSYNSASPPFCIPKASLVLPCGTCSQIHALLALSTDPVPAGSRPKARPHAQLQEVLLPPRAYSGPVWRGSAVDSRDPLVYRYPGPWRLYGVTGAFVLLPPHLSPGSKLPLHRVLAGVAAHPSRPPSRPCTAFPLPQRRSQPSPARLSKPCLTGRVWETGRKTASLSRFCS